MAMIVPKASSMKKPSHMVNCVRREAWQVPRWMCAETETKKNCTSVNLCYPCLVSRRHVGSTVRVDGEGWCCDDLGDGPVSSANILLLSYGAGVHRAER